MKKLIILSLLGIGLAFGAYAQSGAVAPGSPAPDFSLPDAVSGKNISLADHKGQKAIVLIFTSNYCPYSRLYEDRINNLAGQYKNQGVSFLLINSNDASQNKEESEASMKEKAQESGLPYLSDKQQVMAKKYGATKTPEVYVLAPQNGNFVVFYSGAIDDNPQIAADVREAYLQQALDSILTGKTAVVKTKRPVGCMIKAKE